MMSFLFTLVFASALACLAEAQSTGNIAFELPDLVSFLPFGTDTYLLEAFKDKDNDNLLEGGKPQMMRWVSLGVPKLLTTRSTRRPNDPFRMFQITRSGVSVHVLLLTDKQRNLLVAAVKQKYGIDVKANQILQLIPARFECSLNAFGDDSLVLHGRVGDFQSNPLRIDFEVVNNSYAGGRFLNRLASTPELFLDVLINCEINSQGILRKQNVMQLSGEQIVQISLDDRLFGPAQSTMVTRDQLTELASEIYTSLNVREDYEVPEERFEQAVVESLVRQAASVGFGMTPVREALAGISTYKLDYSDRDLLATHIYKNMSEAFELVHEGKKSHLKQRKGSAQLVKDRHSSSGSGSGGSCGFICFNRGSDSNRWASSWKSTSYETDVVNKEMLNELHKEFGTEVKWGSEGDKVIPKEINVAKLMRTDFKKGFTFSQVARFAYEAPFTRSIALYTRDFEIVEDIFAADRASIQQFRWIHDTSLIRVVAAIDQLVGPTRETMVQKVVAMNAAEDASFAKVNALVTERVNDVRSKADARIAACQVCYQAGNSTQVCSALSNAQNFGPQVTMSGEVALAFKCQANV